MTSVNPGKPGAYIPGCKGKSIPDRSHRQKTSGACQTDGGKPVPVSVVCVYNDRNILESSLLKSLAEQTIHHEKILLDNTLGAYRSAAEALNRGGRIARGEYLLFAHQDIELGACNWLERAVGYMEALGNDGMAGVAGKSGDAKSTITNLTHGFPPGLAGGIQISAPREVQTLDECLFIVPKSLFLRLGFDETTCDDWHLYAVDYCLSAKRLSYKIYVLPLPAHHRSRGHFLSKKYFFSLARVMDKHEDQTEVIYTTIHNWHLNRPLIFQKIQQKYESVEEKLLKEVLRLLDRLGIRRPLKAVLSHLFPKNKKGLS